MAETAFYYKNIDLRFNELRNALLNPLTDAEMTALEANLGPDQEGLPVYNKDDHNLYVWDGVQFFTTGGSVSWSSITGIPTTIVYTSNSYSNPSWITSLAWSKITGVPSFSTTLAALTDVSISGLANKDYLRYNSSTSKWENTALSTLAGFGITDAYTKTELQTSGQSSVHWDNITNVPTFSTTLDGLGDVIITTPSTGQLLRYNGTDWINWTPDFVITSRTITINGNTQDLSSNRTWTLTTDDVSEGSTNKYFTQLAARQSISLTTTGNSGASTYNNTSGVLNIPQYTLAGLGGISLTSLSATSPISYDNTTGIISVTTGYTIPTNTQVTNFGTAYDRSITGVSFNTSDGVVTFTKQDTSTLTVDLDGRWALLSHTHTTSDISDWSTAWDTKFSGKTTDNLTEGSTNKYYSDSLSRAAISETITGIDYNNTTGVLSLTSGYVIPTTTQETNWNTAYTNRITSLTTTGSSGAATLISNILNIPQYTLAGLGGISLSSLSATTPLQYDNSTGVFSIAQSTTSTNGYLSSTDWNTFNSKEPAITSGTTSQYWRGDKTWQTLDKTAVGLGNVENTALSTWTGSTNITTLGTIATGTWNATTISTGKGGTGLTSIGTANQILGVNSGATALEYKSLATGTSGTDFNIAHTANTVTLNFPTASASNRGLLSSANWTTFNNKIGGSGSANFIPSFSGASTLTTSPVQTDGSNIGIGIAANASYRITTNGVVNASGYRATNNDGLANVTNTAINIITNSGTGITYNVPGGGYPHDFKEGTNTLMRIGNSQILFNTTTSSVFTVDVSGTLRATTSVTTPLLVNTGNLTLPTVTSTVVTYKTSTTASSATPSPTGDAWDNRFTVTALATNPTFAAPSGTPVDGNTLIIRIKDNGTSRTLSWNAIYRAGTDFSLPTATTISKTLYVQFVYNSADSKWDLIGKTDGF